MRAKIGAMDTIHAQVAHRLDEAVKKMEEARGMGDEPVSPTELALMTMAAALVEVAVLLAKELDALRADTQKRPPDKT